MKNTKGFSLLYRGVLYRPGEDIPVLPEDRAEFETIGLSATDETPETEGAQSQTNAANGKRAKSGKTGK